MDRLPKELIYVDYKDAPKDKEEKILLEDFTWIDPIWGEIVVPRGFVFDGASIPSRLWSVVELHPYSSKVVDAAVVHDYLYCSQKLDREQSDDVFRRILLYEDRLPRVTVQVLYRVIRIFGGSHFETGERRKKYIFPEYLEKIKK